MPLRLLLGAQVRAAVPGHLWILLPMLTDDDEDEDDEHDEEDDDGGETGSQQHTDAPTCPLAWKTK